MSSNLSKQYFKTLLFRLMILCSVINFAEANQNDLDIVKSRLFEDLGGNLPGRNTVIDLQNSLRSDGTWAGVSYDSDRSWSGEHLSRLFTMCKYYRYSTQTPIPGLKDDIIRVIDAWIRIDPTSSNWWNNHVGTPKVLGESVLIMEQEISQSLLNRVIPIIGRGYLPRSNQEGTNSGANRIDRSYGTLLRALLTGDEALAHEAILSIGDTVRVKSAHSFDEGIQADGSFQQHGPQFFLDSYGAVYLQRILTFALISHGTSISLDSDQMSLVIDFFLDGIQWVIRGDSVEYTAMGRDISRENRHNVGLYRLGIARDLIEICNGYRVEELNQFLSRLNRVRSIGEADPATALVGNRNYWQSDFMVHHRPDFSISVKTHSKRTSAPERGNGEGLKNLHLGDGMTIIHRTGNEYDNIMPCWDWRRLPGTTTLQKNYSLKPPKEWGVTGNTDYAGGVSNGEDGIHVYNFSSIVSDKVRAKKSWFFFGDTLIALGAGITCDSSVDVLTTLNQCLAKGPLTVYNGSNVSETNVINHNTANTWAHHDEVGYFFPELFQGNSIEGRIKTQSGNWRSLRDDLSSSTVSKEVFSIEVNHGGEATNHTYAYLVKPGITAAEMPSFPLDDYEILSNTTAIQAVRHAPSQTTGVVFRSPGSIAGITSSDTACVLRKQYGNAIKVSVSEFTQTNNNGITLEFDRAYHVLHADSPITVQEGTSNLVVNFDTDNSFGRSFDLWLTERPETFDVYEVVAFEDTFAYDSQPNQNYGAARDLIVKSTGSNGGNRESFFKFNLPNVGGSPLLASLKLNCKSSNDAGIHGIRPVDPATWQESNLTWNNRPIASGPADVRWIPKGGEGSTGDASSLLNYAVGNEMSLRVATYARSGGNGYVGYSSREANVESQRPTLVLIYPRPELGSPEFDTWRTEHFGEGTLSEFHTFASSDPDHDGIENIIEFVTGQDPSSPSGDLITLVRSNGDGLKVYAPRRLNSGFSYKVMSSVDLTNGSWEDLSDRYPVTIYSTQGDIETLEIQVPSAEPDCFFRIEVAEE